MFDFLMDSGTLAIILTAILALLGIVGFGVKKKLNEVANALTESGDVFASFKNALADNKFSKEEVDELIEEINQARGAWRNVFAEKK